MSDDAPPELSVDIVEEAGSTVLVVRGELDACTAPTLDAAFDEVMAAGARRVVLDLADVGFIDSSGLRSMIRARRQAGDAEDSLRIRDPQATTVRLLEITGLSGHFPVT